MGVRFRKTDEEDVKHNNLPDVVLYSFFPWKHQYPSTAHGLAKALAAVTRVFYVSKPLTYKDAFAKPGRVKSMLGPVVKEVTSFNGQLLTVDLPPTLPINALPPGSLYEVLRKRNDRKLCKQIDAVMQRYEVEDYIFINLWAPTQFVQLCFQRQPCQRIYYGVDATGEVDYTARHGLAAEQAQVEAADLVLATSTQLAQQLTAASPGAATRTHVLPNAMDADLFLSTEVVPEPIDLAAIPHPRVAYLGNLDPLRIDFAGLEVLAKARPDISFVFIGPWNAGESVRHTFEALPNVYLLGRKRQHECPAYLQHCDAGIIPFVCSPLTAAIYPLKINEYLGLGLPVLSTRFSADIADFADLISLAPIEEWPSLIQPLIDGNCSCQQLSRQQRARQNTWDMRAATLLELAGCTNRAKRAATA